MPTTVNDLLSRLLATPLSTASALLELPDGALQQPSSHVCAHGGDTWALITNLIDHETEHLGQVVGSRYEGGPARTPIQRLVAEWMEARARFAGALVGLSEAEFSAPMAPGQWSYQQAAQHLLDLEQHALKTIARDLDSRTSTAAEVPDA